MAFLGREEGQLWYPRKVAVMLHSGKYVVCDRGNERSRMQIFTKNGHFMKKIAIRYIDIVAGLAINYAGTSSLGLFICLVTSSLNHVLEWNLVHWLLLIYQFKTQNYVYKLGVLGAGCT